MARLVAVTGATGFIGKALCQRLVDGGDTVRALIRDPKKASQLPPGITSYRGDITDRSSLAGLVNGADAVVHCAGNVRGATQAQFDTVNVDGVRHLIDTLKSMQTAPKLLCLSSMAAREPALSFYATSKLRGEQLLVAEAQSLEWAVLRPPAVYGPGDKELLPLFKLMLRGYALVPGSRQARFSMIYIDDLTHAISTWIDSQQAMTGIFSLEDGTEGGYDWPTVAETLSQLSGRPVRVLQIPSPMLDCIAWINRTAARVLGYAPMLTPEKLRELRHEDWVCNSQALHAALGWKARTTLQSGLQSTLYGNG